MERAHILSRAAYAGLVALVAGFLAFALGAASVTDIAARIAAAATQRSGSFSAARFDLAAEQSLHQTYELQPGGETLRLHAEAARRFVAELLAVRKLSDVRARRDIDELLLAHQRYFMATQTFFGAVDRHGTTRARTIDRLSLDPAFAAIQIDVDAEARRRKLLAVAAQDMLGKTEAFLIALTLAISLMAIIALGAIVMVLRHDKRHLDRTVHSETARLKKAARIDHLTGLGNHHAYQEDLLQLPSDGHLHASALTIALINIDEFKALNDRAGHVTGDRILALLARILRGAAVPSTAYRLGGDTFALAFRGMPPHAARERVERLRAIIEAELDGTTVSAGLASAGSSHCDLAVLREEASTALHEAKRRGRNAVVAFEEIRAESTMFLPERVAEVRELIAGASMGVAFQPIWDLLGRTVIGYEALARPAGEDPVNPQDAFDIAERLGKAHDLDRACRAAVLEKARMLPPNALLFLNISPQSLDHQEFCGTTLIDAVEAAGFRPERVVLEITERSLARLPVVIREARRLRELGFALALDDAGSGNSGLEMLSQLAVDFVKIDRQVVVRAQSDIGGRAVLAGIVAIAQEMQAQIIAEGIEDGVMLDLVRDATRWSTISSAVQGYYLGRPSQDFVDASTLAAVGERLAPAPLEARAKPERDESATSIH